MVITSILALLPLQLVWCKVEMNQGEKLISAATSLEFQNSFPIFCPSPIFAQFELERCGYMEIDIGKWGYIWNLIFACEPRHHPNAATENFQTNTAYKMYENSYFHADTAKVWETHWLCWLPNAQTYEVQNSPELFAKR